MSIEGYSDYVEILRVLGNSDQQKGLELLTKIYQRILYARDCHKWGRDGEIYSRLLAYMALEGEVKEYQHACHMETVHREFDEILDVIAVAIRIANREYEK